MYATIEQIADWIRTHDNVAVITHGRPDGDAYGCALGMVRIFRALGKRAFPVDDDRVEPRYGFLEGSDEFTNEINGLPFEPECAFGVDCSDAERMKNSRALFERFEDRAAIDHHDSDDGLFAPLVYVEPEASACGEIVLKLVRLLNVEMDRPLAECIYTAIATDSGNFSFRSTSAFSLRAAADCVEAGADPEKLTRILFRERSLAKTRLLGYGLSSMVLSPGGRVAGMCLPDAAFEACRAEREDSHNLVNYMNEIDGVYVGILCEERPNGVRISFRGAHDTDVAALAAKFGGGGHTAAAGATVDGCSLEEKFREVMREAAKYVGEAE